jgi:hypothetical protein
MESYTAARSNHMAKLFRQSIDLLQHRRDLLLVVG